MAEARAFSRAVTQRPVLLCHAVLPRAGLANRLFTWARCKLFSLKEGVPMVTPFYAQLKVGPILRREKDRRLYWRQLRSAPGEITGLRRLWVLTTWARIQESQVRSGLAGSPDRRIVEFRGMADFFAPLNGHNSLIRRELDRTVHPHWRAVAASLDVPPIGIHVRRGDFHAASEEADFVSRGALRTPVSWFVDSLAFIRRHVGSALSAFVVSDGNQADLAELLAVPGVRWIRTGSAIGDLLALSRAKVLLASGGSSFSAWASYLGEMPAIARPGQSLAWFKLSQENGAFVGEYSPGQSLPATLLESL